MSLTALLFALVAMTGTDGSESASDRLRILDFHTPRCAPCLQMRPEIAKLKDKGYSVESVYGPERPDVVARYAVDKFPTLIIVDSSGTEMARSVGYQPAKAVANFYHDVHARWKTKTVRAQSEPVEPQPLESDQAEAPKVKAEPGKIKRISSEISRDDLLDVDSSEIGVGQNPRPWETVVRIQIHGAGSHQFGSGTVIYSDEKKSLILTCAHIFRIDEMRIQPNPKRYPRRITVDLFDGVLHGRNPAQVHTKETVEGRVLDYNEDSDVGLLAIRPGRKLPASPLVPTDWKAQPGMLMDTVGCSFGNDATAWTTSIVQPLVRLLNEETGRFFEGVECEHRPKQGRSGGGLYTRDGYLAGVCNFANQKDPRGYYAVAKSVYSLLDRNELTVLYDPSADNQTRLADNNNRQDSGRTVARGQSPDDDNNDETQRISLPSPRLLGVPPIKSSDKDSAKLASEGLGIWRKVSPESSVDDRDAPTPNQNRRGRTTAAGLGMNRNPNDESSLTPTPTSPKANWPTNSQTKTAEPRTKSSGIAWKPAAEPFPEWNAANSRR